MSKQARHDQILEVLVGAALDPLQHHLVGIAAEAGEAEGIAWSMNS